MTESADTFQRWLAKPCRELEVRRDNLLEPLLTPGFAAGEVGGEGLEIVLPAGAVVRQLGERETADLDNQDGPLAVLSQSGVDHFLVRDFALLPRLVRLSVCQHQMTRRLALVDPAGAFPLRAFDEQPELTARPEVPVDLAVPASETLGIGDRRPQIFDVGVVPVFDPRYSFAIHCAQAAKDLTHGLLLLSRFP